ncbi:MAG: hypothetical protein QM658_05755 [Gordonia sp. (in: high G+C Gram-positive bacteria)]
MGRVVDEHRTTAELVRKGSRFSVQLPIVGRVGVPKPQQLAAYGVLGALAAAGVVEWPVAISLAVGLTLAGKSVSALQHHAEAAAGSAQTEAPPTVVDGTVAATTTVPRNTTAKRAARGPSHRVRRR